MLTITVRILPEAPRYCSPMSEHERLAALQRYAILATGPEVAYDRTARLAARLFQVPVAGVTFIDQTQQWFKASVGLPLTVMPRQTSFCQRVVHGQEVLVVPDAQADERFRQLPVVAGAPFVRFYAGAPIVTPDGFTLGTLCLYDTVPRADLTIEERDTLRDLAESVMSDLELRRTLAEQARERQLHTAVLNAAHDAMLLLDATGRVTAWNPAAETMLGYTPAEALGRDLVDLIVEARFHARYRAGFARVVAGGALREHRREVPALRRTGETFPCEFTVSPTWMEDTVWFAVTLRDLTDVEAGRAALRASHALLRTVVDSVPESIFVKDLDLRYVMINVAGALQIGRSEMEILGCTDEQLFPATTARLARERDQQVLCGQTLTYEVADHLPGGEQRTYWSTKVPTRDAAGAVSGLVGVAIDISERQAAEAAIYEHNAQLGKRVEAAQLEILGRLARAAEYRDDDTGEHMGRVALTAGGLARELGLPDETVRLIKQAAPLHDVGKIGVPDGILLKPGRLNPEEFEAVKAHVRIGAEILAEGQSPVMQLAEQIALTHHERWDGGGYPNGLAGTAIPIEGRIVAVADVLDALTNVRPYKPAWPLETALAEIRAQAGRQFDPQVVEALERLATRRVTPRAS